MPIRFYSPGKRKKPSRVVRPNRKRDEALQKTMAQAVQMKLGNAFKRLRQGVSSDVLADAYMSGDYAAIFKEVKLSRIPDLLADAMAKLQAAGDEGGKRGARALPPTGGPGEPGSLRYDLANPVIRQYIAGRQGALIENVSDQFQQTVSGLVQRRFASGLSDQGIQMGLLDQTTRNGVAGYVLKNSLGLDSRRAGALAAKAASGEYTQEQLAKYESDAHVSRAATIARTETAYAMNNGQLAVWNEAQAQGLLGPEARKVWTVDAEPCPICQPMDGIAVLLNEQFILPNGERVDGPPGHPACLCLCAVLADQSDEAPLNR